MSTIRTLAILFLAGSAMAADLHPQLKQPAEEYDRAMKGFETSVAAQSKIARDAYLAVLENARKREEAAKRPKGVAGVDAELAAVKAGSALETADLPTDLKVYRDRFVDATKRAASSNDSVRKRATDQYLKYLTQLEGIARGKDEALVAAIIAERNRVNASAPKDPAK